MSMYRRVRTACSCLALLLPPIFPAQTRAGSSTAGDELQVYFVDVEGGQATLFVTPDKHSLLIDTGWPGNNGRDADRIAAAAKRAGVAKLDYVLITHYHDDHVGGVPQLVARLPVGTFLDHGPNRERDGGVTERGFAAYQQVLTSSKAQQRTMHPGETISLGGLDLRVISADGKLLEQPLAGAGKPNPFCSASEQRPADATENSRSLGVELTFGRLTMLDLGDLTWDKEMQLMCPDNKLGHVEVYIVSHHGWYQSSSPALVHAIAPRVAIMDNGETKGGSTPTLETVQKSPGLSALWQLHYSAEGGAAHNAGEPYLANLKGSTSGNYLQLSGKRDGSFRVLNSRTGNAKSYPAPVKP